LFAAMLRGGCVTRTSAIELLTVDALVTYAFERGSDDPEHMEAQAQRAMIKLATLPATVGAS